MTVSRYANNHEKKGQGLFFFRCFEGLWRNDASRYSEPLIKMDVLVHNCQIFYAQLQMEAAVSRPKSRVSLGCSGQR